MLLAAEPAWHVTSRRHCCRLDKKLKISPPWQPRSTDMYLRHITRPRQVDHDSRLLYLQRTNISVPTTTTRKHQHGGHGTLSSSRRTECAMPIPSATCRNRTGMSGEFCTCCFELFSMQIDAGLGRDGVTQMGTECKSPKQYIN